MIFNFIDYIISYFHIMSMIFTSFPELIIIPRIERRMATMARI